jgi:butyrate response factor 1
MNATSEATDTPVSSFASFGEEARQDPPGDARRSERAPDSFEACDALVDELIEDDRGRHFGALARLREDRQRRATTNVEETTGRGFYATARARLSDPAVRDARELRDASLSREPFEDASARVTLAERARARPASDDVGLVAPRASLFPNEEALSETAAEALARGPPQKILSAPASPFVPRRAADATPRGSPSPATPLDWSRTPPWTPRSAAKTAAAPVAGSNPRAHGAASRAFAQSLARRDNAPASPSSSPLSSPGGAAGVDAHPHPRPRGVRSIQAASAHAHHSPTHHSTYAYGNGNAFVPARRADSLDLGVSGVASRGETRASETYGGGAYFFDAAPESAATARVFPMGSAPASPGDFFPGAQSPGFERHREPANALYKTELCRSWEETGSCRYGGKCQFAHGRDELRPVMRHPKYKTEVCRTFAQSGACPYGTRCRFIHYRVPTRSVCGTLIAGAHNVIPTDWSPETASASARAASAGEGTSARRGALRAGADARGGGGGDDARDSDGRASNPLDARRLPVFRDLAALSAGPAADSAAGAGFRGGDSAEGRDFSAEPFPFAFVAERRASASAAASAVRRGPAAPPCASGAYDIGASVLFGNV